MKRGLVFLFILMDSSVSYCVQRLEVRLQCVSEMTNLEEIACDACMRATSVTIFLTPPYSIRDIKQAVLKNLGFSFNKNEDPIWASLLVIGDSSLPVGTRRRSQEEYKVTFNSPLKMIITRSALKILQDDRRKNPQ